MKKSEKYILEKAAIDIFIKKNKNIYTIIKHCDKPDFILLDTEKSKIGVEVSYLYYDEKEAKLLFNRCEGKSHGVMNTAELINKLNNLLLRKYDKLKNYNLYDKYFLIIRVVSPIFDISTFKLYRSDINNSENNYNEIWLITDDNTKKLRSSELFKIK